MTGTEIVPSFQGDLVSADFAELEAATRRYEKLAIAENTKRSYRSAWANFTAWCESKGIDPLPAEPRAIAHYLTASADAGTKAGTIHVRLTAIGVAHRLAGFPFDAKHPQIDGAWRGIKNALGTRPDRKAPILTNDLRRMVKALPDTLIGKRDRALLLLGFGGALRRSELVALRVEDVKPVRHGVVVLIRRSKTDQEGQGAEVGIQYSKKTDICAALALQAWLKESGITTGPIFRPIGKGGRILEQQLSDRAVADVVKAAVALVGLDPKLYSGHSLRAGCATSAANAGYDLMQIMQQTRHKSVDVAKIYVREVELFRNNVTAKIF